MLLATAAGIVLKNNLERIGPLALALLMGIAATACYAWTWWRRSRASLVDDYVLLLGALLVSADVAFIESQFHLLGASWQRHFLLLAIVHAIGAYAYGSRMVLSLSIAAFAAWLRVDPRPLFNLTFSGEVAMRAYLCAALLLVWRAVDLRVRKKRDFAPLFEHFAANLALAAGFVFLGDSVTVGMSLTVVVAMVVIACGVRMRRESFVLYAFLYAVIAIDILVANQLPEDTVVFLFIIVSTIAAIVGLIVIHARMRDSR
ncbi:MAG TPA: hypothetical protein VJZ00_13450 [Thermoanaerobaculia bacterium]|nr:hypothetical protein [Thermoanaerobaculia bacterium]